MILGVFLGFFIFIITFFSNFKIIFKLLIVVKQNTPPPPLHTVSTYAICLTNSVTDI